jgi:hypothetical protein
MSEVLARRPRTVANDGCFVACGANAAGALKGRSCCTETGTGKQISRGGGLMIVAEVAAVFPDEPKERSISSLSSDAEFEYPGLCPRHGSPAVELLFLPTD